MIARSPSALMDALLVAGALLLAPSCATPLHHARLSPVPTAEVGAVRIGVPEVAVAPALVGPAQEAFSAGDEIVALVDFENRSAGGVELDLSTWSLLVTGANGVTRWCRPTRTFVDRPHSREASPHRRPGPILVPGHERGALWVAFSGPAGVPTGETLDVRLAVPAASADVVLASPASSSARWASTSRDAPLSLGFRMRSWQRPGEAELLDAGWEVLAAAGRFVYGFNLGSSWLRYDDGGAVRQAVGGGVGARAGWLPFDSSFGLVGGAELQLLWDQREVARSHDFLGTIRTVSGGVRWQPGRARRPASPVPLEARRSPFRPLSWDVGYVHYFGGRRLGRGGALFASVGIAWLSP